MNNSLSITIEKPGSTNQIQFVNSSEWSVNEWVDFVYQNPYSDTNVLNGFKEMGKFTLISEFLNEYYLTYKMFPHFFFDNKNLDAFQWLPLQTRCQLISLFPTTFMALIQPFNESQKKELFQDFVDEDWCKLLLEGFLHTMPNASTNSLIPENHLSYLFVQFILDVLSNAQQKEVVNYFNSNLRHQEWVFFLLISMDLEPYSDQYNTLVFDSRYSESNSEQVIDDIFEAMLSPLVRKHQSQKLVKALLDHFFLSPAAIDCLLEEFADCPSENQVYLLEVFDDEILNYIFSNYSKDFKVLARWCELIFKNSDNFNKRIRILKLLCEHIDENALKHFIRAILRTSQPACAGYLFHCLKENAFAELIEGNYVTTRKKIFDSMEIDSGLVDFLKAWHQHPSKEILEQAMTFDFSWNEKISDFQIMDEGNLMVIHEQYTIDRCFEKLLQLFLEPEVIGIHESFIHQIPPIFLAIFAKDKFRRDVLFSLSMMFTNKQLKFLMFPFWDDFYEAIHDITDYKIRLDQVLEIFLSLPKDRFSHFVNQKITFLKNSLSEFEEQIKKLDLKINKIKSRTSIIQYYNGIKENLLEMQAIMKPKGFSAGIKELDFSMMKIEQIRSNFLNKKKLNEAFDAKLLKLGAHYLNSDQNSSVELLIAEVDAINSQFLIKQHQFDLLETNLLNLRSIYMRSEHLTCKAIARFFCKHDFYSLQFIRFKNIQNCLKSHESLINNDSKIRKNLDFIEAYIDGKDKPASSIVDLLPEWFWVLIRSQDIDFFKAIDHFEELKEVGIRSCEDILSLGVSMRQQQYLEKSFQEIFNLRLYNLSEREKILNSWNKIIRIDLEKEQLEKSIDDFSELMTGSINFYGIKTLTQLLYSIIEPFEFIHSDEKLKLEKKIKEIQKNVRYYSASKMGKKVMKKIAVYLRQSHPRVVLQKYLNQDNLIEKWKNLQSQGFQSIDDLIKKKQLSVSELFDL